MGAGRKKEGTRGTYFGLSVGYYQSSRQREGLEQKKILDILTMNTNDAHHGIQSLLLYLPMYTYPGDNMASDGIRSTHMN